MQDHALPQDVTGYKFHIIGNMTLKQFGEVAAGCIVGFLLYQTNLLPIIKIPLIVIAAGAGAMVAFVPIEERPLDQWITAFFNALYRPTQYYWKRMVKIPEPFLYQPRSEMRTVVEDVDLTPARRQRVKDYLRTIDEKPALADQFDQYTTQRLDEVMGEFGSQLTPSLGYDQTSLSTPETDEAAILNASPDSVSVAVDSLSFAGRGTSEETVMENSSSPQEIEMSNNVLRLFDTNETPLPTPDTVPQYQPEPTPEYIPKPTAPTPDVISSSTPSIEPPLPEPIPEPLPEPIPEPKPVPEPIPEPEPIITLKPVREVPKPQEIETPPLNSFVPPTPVASPAVQEPPKPREVPKDMTELPDVSLTPEVAVAEPSEIPQISTVFEGPPAPAESIPKVQTMDKYSLSAHAQKQNADSSEVADVAQVISMGSSHRRGKNSVQFKTSRSNQGDRFETVLPHILDMTGVAESVKIEPQEAPVEKPLPENKEVVVPEMEDIRVTQTVKAPEEAAIKDPSKMSEAVDPSLLDSPEKLENIAHSGAVTYNTDLPFPEKPTKPNKVVGMVLDQAGNSQPNAIVEILSPDGIPARAVKTNPLGQFFIATPLNPGDYLITAEKEGFEFPTQQLAITNKIIDPIEIRAN